MIEIKGDLWDVPADIRVITTNGTVKNNGEAVMGGGCAKEAALRYPSFPRLLGDHIRNNGNVPHLISADVICVPVKHDVRKHADVDLIKTSVRRLVEMIDEMFAGDCVVAVPRFGSGLGGLDWKDIKQIVEPMLDDRFIVVSYEDEND